MRPSPDQAGRVAPDQAASVVPGQTGVAGLGARDNGPGARDKLRRAAMTVALTLMLIVLWLMMHRYPGIVNDAQIYAFQAMARLQPALRSDLYLQHTSQDAYTLFSPFYAWVIGWFDVERATLGLTVLFIVWLLTAAWALARELCSAPVAWLAVAALIIVSGAYGGSGVFQFTDSYLTARMPAEALVTMALWLHFAGRKRLGLLVAVGALFVHPLMALPGLVLLVTLWLPTRQALLGGALGILGTLCIAIAAKIVPAVAEHLTIMDPAWLNVVRERSQFLFLDLWSAADWRLNAQPFLALALAACVFREGRMRMLIVGALLVGATGLVIALIAALVTPVALMVQGQSWRWVWITDFVSILLLAPTVLRIWRNDPCGPICAILVVAGRTVSSLDGSACAAIALLLWIARAHFTGRTRLAIRWVGWGVAVLLAGWMLAVSWTLVSGSQGASRDPLLLTRIRDILGLELPAVIAVGLFWGWIGRSRSVVRPMVAAALLVAVTMYVAVPSLARGHPVGSAAQVAEFNDWRGLIPPTSSVFLADRYDSGEFVWFSLDRPNYLSMDQSAGVVFSRATALEIRRRSDVVLPLMNRFWQLDRFLHPGPKGATWSIPSSYRPLTAANLVSVCVDPELGFVVARENVGFDPMRHTHAGRWLDWNLYDCRRVRAGGP